MKCGAYGLLERPLRLREYLADLPANALPDGFDGVEVGTVGWEEHESHVEFLCENPCRPSDVTPGVVKDQYDVSARISIAD